MEYIIQGIADVFTDILAYIAFTVVLAIMWFIGVTLGNKNEHKDPPMYK